MDYVKILRRAEDKIKEIKYKISHLENEKRLLDQIVYATQIPSEAQLYALIKQYKEMYKGEQPWST